MKIYIGADHAGYELKEKLKNYLSGLGYEVEDKGAFNYDENDDYPDFVTPVAKAVAEDPESEGRRGIVLGGSGQGEAMCANKVRGVRAAVFYGEILPEDAANLDSFEIIKLTREHNDANVLAIGARFVSEDEMKFAVELFLSTKFSGEEKHQRRLAKF